MKLYFSYSGGDTHDVISISAFGIALQIKTTKPWKLKGKVCVNLSVAASRGTKDSKVASMDTQHLMVQGELASQLHKYI